MPTLLPTSAGPTFTPSQAPTGPELTNRPSASPTTAEPTDAPSQVPTSPGPTAGPTSVPSSSPTAMPSAAPSPVPTVLPTSMPSNPPASSPPTVIPSGSPSTMAPTGAPSTLPSARPSVGPTTKAPTVLPTTIPKNFECCRDDELDGVVWSIEQRTCTSDFVIIGTCPDDQAGELSRTCRFVDATLQNRWMDLTSTCESASIRTLSEINLTAAVVVDVFANLSDATETASSLSPADVSRVAEIMSQGVEMLHSGNVWSSDLLLSFVGTTSNLLDAPQQSLDHSGASADSDTDNATKATIVEVIEAFSAAIADTLEEGSLVQVVDNNLVLTSFKLDIEEGVTFPLEGVSTLAPGFSSCSSGGNGSQVWECESVRPVAGSSHSLEMAAALSKVRLQLPPLKFIVANTSSVSSAAVEIVVYANAKIFTTVAERTGETSLQREVLKPVVMATVPGAATAGGNIPFANGASMSFRLEHDATDLSLDARSCCWYDAAEGGRWNTSGCELVPEESSANYTTCRCTHLTSFAVLMDLSPPTGKDRATTKTTGEDTTHALALSLISYVGVGVSILCLFATFVVYLVLEEARSFAKKILMHLCVSLIAAMVLFLIAGSTSDVSETSCRVISASLHYWLLASFFWMLIQGHQIYHTFVLLFQHRTDESATLWRFGMIAYGVPAVISITTALVWPNSPAEQTMCWLSGDRIWAFAGPAFCVIFINLCYFALTMRAIQHVNQRSHRKGSAWSVDSATVKRNFKATASFFSLMGITWLFGLLSLAETDNYVYQYIFAGLNSLTGLWIFIFHCCTDPAVKTGWERHRQLRAKKRRRTTHGNKRSRPPRSSDATNSSGQSRPSGWSRSSDATDSVNNFSSSQPDDFSRGRPVGVDFVKQASADRLSPAVQTETKSWRGQVRESTRHRRMLGSLSTFGQSTATPQRMMQPKTVTGVQRSSAVQFWDQDASGQWAEKFVDKTALQRVDEANDDDDDDFETFFIERVLPEAQSPLSSASPEYIDANELAQDPNTHGSYLDPESLSLAGAGAPKDSVMVYSTARWIEKHSNEDGLSWDDLLKDLD